MLGRQCPTKLHGQPLTRCIQVNANEILPRNQLPTPLFGDKPSTALPQRRQLLGACTAIVLQSHSFLLNTAEASTSQQQMTPVPYTDPSLPPEFLKYWLECVGVLKAALGAQFDASISIWGPTARLPRAAPGDPAKDSSSRQSGGQSQGRCGAYRFGTAASPYASCPAPGVASDDPITSSCCRHFAYCVPRSVFSFTAAEKTSWVVVSPRVLSLPTNNWQAILAHELGHAIDFWLYGDRYNLRSNTGSLRLLPFDTLLALKTIDKEEDDVEARADLLGELFLLTPKGLKLCYDRTLTIQTIVNASVDCSAEQGLMRHFPHPLVAGTRRRIL